jgi:signal transduction histidine kinase
LAASMAKNAIGHLGDAVRVAPDGGSTTTARDVADRILAASSGLASLFATNSGRLGRHAIPGQAAEAIFSAAVHAMVNSVQHAGGGRNVVRWVRIDGDATSAIRVEIGDTGVGFDVSAVPMERLGVRVSIMERVSSAGGAVTLDSSIGKGTIVTIRWPAPESAPAEGPS